MISQKFEELRTKGEKGLVLFVTAGDPRLSELPNIVEALAEAGADFIEIGVPFSDPIADGPVIQASSQRALDNGVTPPQILDTIKQIKSSVPLILMGYLNPVLRMGLDTFAAGFKEAGVSGVIISDIIPEEGNDWKRAASKHGLSTIFLAAPTSTDERLRAVCEATTGFVYAVSRTGVTGLSTSNEDEVQQLVSRLRPHTNLPIAVGFGISEPEHVRSVCKSADAAVVGSWLVKRLATEWESPSSRADLLGAVRSLKEATKGF